MSQAPAAPQLPTPRLLVVLAGAASVGTKTATALERASVPNLAAMAERGRCGRLRAVAPHLPTEEPSAYATLLGTAAVAAFDAGAIAAESSGATLARGEQCALVEVVDHSGDAAPALHVARAAEVLRGQLPHHRIAAVRRGNQILLAGARRPTMPLVDGLELRLLDAGWVPERPALDDTTVVIAAAGSSILGVARLLGARTVVVDGIRAGRADPVPARLRTAANRALLSGAGTIVVESTAPLVARRGLRDEPARERAVAEVLARLDRELVGPLRATAAWRSAGFAVTADIARRSTGQPVSGDVPLIVAGDRATAEADAPMRPAADGALLPPRYSERGVEGRAIVTSPWMLPPARDPDAPVRFRRDRETGVTVPESAG
jgi:hypothetical protein